MSVSAAELPAMSGAPGDGGRRSQAYLRARLDGGLRQIAFFVVPSAMAFLALGHVIVGALFQTGEFRRRGFDVRVGHPRRLGRRAARLDAGPTLRLGVLRAARHAHAAPLRHRPGGAHRRLRLVRRAPAARPPGLGPRVGRRRADRVRRDRGLGRVRAAPAARWAREIGRDRPAGRAPAAALGCPRGAGCGGRVARADASAGAPPRAGRRDRARRLRGHLPPGRTRCSASRRRTTLLARLRRPGAGRRGT